MNYNNLIFFNKSGHQTNLIWNGNFWEARLMLPRVSVDLFETEHFFIVEKFKDLTGKTVYGYPHITPDVNADSSAAGIYGEFVLGSNLIRTDVPPLQDYVGSKLFCAQFPNGSEILSVDPVNNTITIQDNAILSEINVTLLFNIWKVSFETTRNVIDFDLFTGLKASIVSGRDYITVNVDTDQIKYSEYKLVILGDGIPKDARITSASGKNIYLNKICNVTLTNSDVFIYPIEERNDVSEYIYQYNITEDVNLDAPILNVIQDAYYKIDYDSTETFSGTQRISDSITSSSVSINLTLNSPDEGIFGRTLVIEDLSLGYPKLIARIEIHGETIGEDERYKILLKNFGRSLNNEDAYIIRDSDPSEPYPDYDIVNTKRKELLLEGHEIFPYMGSYKGLINAIRFFGYQDLRIKEYWMNIKKSGRTPKSALSENQSVIDSINSQIGSQSTLIANIHDDENSGKYKQVEVYGKKDDGTYGIKSSLEQIFPSSSFKKTSLFGLYYDINRTVEDEFDEFGYPVVENVFAFSPEEVLIKLFGLKEKLKKDYLPLNARIIDITGEGVYFEIYKTRGWIDQLKIDELNQGIDVEISATPKFGYIEDLRPFGLRPNNSIPYTPYVGPDPFEYNYTTYGNVTLPTVANNYLSPTQSEKLANAIDSFYYERDHLGVPKYRLGDGDSKMGGYFKLGDGQKYEVPSGFPTVLEVTSFNLSWDELDNKWGNLDRNIAYYTTTTASLSNITSYTGNPLISSSVNYTFDPLTGFGQFFNVTLPTGIAYLTPSAGRLQLKFTSNSDSSYSFLAEVFTYNNSTGNAYVKLLWSKTDAALDNWKVELVNLFSDNVTLNYYDYSFHSDGYYSWGNLRFAGFYEIEWTVTKTGENPYKYQTRDKLNKYWRIPLILPYSGVYSVRCRVWNGFNDICTAYFNEYIEVKTREIEIVNVARFREAEVYTWDNTKRAWEDYDSRWLFPVERMIPKFQISENVDDAAEYGNQFNEGQECMVLKTFGEVVATAAVDFGLKPTKLTGFTSLRPGGGIGPVIATINPSYLPHTFANGDFVTIIDNNVGTLINRSGSYEISNVTTTGFTLPFTSTEILNPLLINIIKTGTITVSYDNNICGTVDFNGRLDSTLGNLMFSINNSTKEPKFGIDTIESSNITDPFVTEWLRVTFKAPLGSGSSFNGKVLSISMSGGIYAYNGLIPVQSYNAPIINGANSYDEYVDYEFNGDLPTENTRFYGTKALNWDAFDLLDWDNVYAQTWGMYDYHNDWLGGFSIYNIKNRDKLRVGKDTTGITMDESILPNLSLDYLDLNEACIQLNNSKDPGISKFTYSVNGFSKLPDNYGIGSSPIGAPLTALAIPYNESTDAYDVQTGTSPSMDAPTSITQNPSGDIIMGGDYFVKLFNSSTNIDAYPIGGEYVGCIPRKVYNDEYDNWWCYGERCQIPLVIYNRNNAESSLVFSTSPISGLQNAENNIIVPVPDSQFQIICLAVDGMTDNFAMYVRYKQYYTSPISSSEDVYKLLFYNASTKEFLDISTTGPAWNITDVYDIGNIVTYNGDCYLKINTQGNSSTFPASGSNANWEKIEFNTPGLIDLSVFSIRQMKYEYVGKKSNLWIATDDGVKIYNGFKISSLRIQNSGISSNDVYSICIDEVNSKWIGTSDGINYYDNERWGCWNHTSDPILPLGKTRNITNIGNGRIFFIVQLGEDNYNLVYFNGNSFKVYTNDPGTVNNFSPINYMDYDYEDLYVFINKVKSINGNFTKYPDDLFYLSEPYRTGDIYASPSLWDFTKFATYVDPVDTYLKKSNYLIPFIHAKSKYPGIEGWDFVHYTPYSPNIDPTIINNIGIGDSVINFSFIVGPLSGVTISGKDPQFPHVDRKSWKIPSWLRYDFDKVLDAFPGTDPDDLFLDAPLRDIIDGSASKEEYWKNSNVARSADRDSGNYIDEYEWVLRIGDTSDDKGISVFSADDGFVYVTGFFTGSIFLGPRNNTSSSTNTTLLSTNCRSIFVAKYNKFGVVQWARKYGEDLSVPSSYDYDYEPTSIKVDRFGNVIVVGYKIKNRNNTTNELSSNFYLRWNWDAELEVSTSLFSSPSSTSGNIIDCVEIDKVGNTYVAGTFNGTLSGGNYTLTTTLQSVFVARIEPDGNIRWINKPNSGRKECKPSISLGKSFEDLYLGYSSIGTTDQIVYFNKYSSYDFLSNWSREFLNPNNGTSVILLDPSAIAETNISTSKNGDIALALTFNGQLITEGLTLTSVGYDSNVIGSGSTDIGIIKFNGYRILWGKTVGSSSIDYAHDVSIDSAGNIYVAGSYGSQLIVSPEYTYPNYYPGPIGNLDVLLLKYSPEGHLIDVVTSGGVNIDEGVSMGLDDEDNIYLTGYLVPNADFINFGVDSLTGGAKDAFVAKIKNMKYKSGKKIGNVYSWLGAESWSAGDGKITNKEFEVPIGTTVVFNPVGSFIPGKKNHIWRLKYDVTSETLIDIKDAQSFIWTFNKPGFYSLYLSVEDTNGNISVFDRQGYIRVINHKNPAPGEIVDLVNSDTFKRRTIYPPEAVRHEIS